MCWCNTGTCAKLVTGDAATCSNESVVLMTPNRANFYSNSGSCSSTRRTTNKSTRTSATRTSVMGTPKEVTIVKAIGTSRVCSCIGPTCPEEPLEGYVVAVVLDIRSSRISLLHLRGGQRTNRSLRRSKHQRIGNASPSSRVKSRRPKAGQSDENKDKCQEQEKEGRPM